MRDQAIFRPLKVFGYVVLLLMVAAIVYSAYISLAYWPGIAV